MKNKYNYKFPLVEKLARESEENLAHIDRQKLSVSEDFVEWKGGSLKMKIKESSFIQELCYLPLLGRIKGDSNSCSFYSIP